MQTTPSLTQGAIFNQTPARKAISTTSNSRERPKQQRWVQSSGYMFEKPQPGCVVHVHEHTLASCDTTQTNFCVRIAHGLDRRDVAFHVVEHMRIRFLPLLTERVCRACRGHKANHAGQLHRRVARCKGEDVRRRLPR